MTAVVHATIWTPPPHTHTPTLTRALADLGAMGFGKADPIAIFSFVMSVLSLIFNIGMACSEARALEAPSVFLRGEPRNYAV